MRGFPLQRVDEIMKKAREKHKKQSVQVSGMGECGVSAGECSVSAVCVQ